ncbi:uroporphyrinogen-III C-methyltransferase [Archaeoglobus sulfaticallidus PM70-1]|uniref:uroporphyrinogen-III C-methyltransferase n=1 Tax=Archaeoglobus sulfaticallidus PM70-1 TaxID=387631 RepID=N0BF79_9EURY|nr:uroporphyrinogen-III C-methyltransferase [Archaeoglobus sulfaticallidus]AGK60922.1 uroporphyrinogen-III C-methyltransferase [Archaeoglobus sulfaticallidus PM70-1]
MEKKGFVYLVGAGPGDPELLTIKALNIIKSADVILYDKLVGDDIVKFLKAMGKEIVYAGKSSHEKGGARQEEINNLMKHYAKMGKIVVRLKGGDPFVFGRGCIEAEFLKKEGIDFEIIPGVSSINAVPTNAGIPLTHPEISSSVLVVTGRDNVLRWKNALDHSTIVILMGKDRIEQICKKLIELGKNPETPVAVIENGTLESQKTIFGSLSTISGKIAKADVKGPALIVVGDVVRFAKNLMDRKV